MSEQQTKLEEKPGGRPAAGEDPVKREQILDGAQCVFMRSGFDAASVNDITREAGVSKGTVYVYFQNKEELFAEMIERQRSRVVELIRASLDFDLPLEETLMNFGMSFVTHLTSDKVVRGARMVIGVLDRMPEIANRFFISGTKNGHLILTGYIEKQAALGTLRNVDDAALVARQYAELCLAGTFRARLFGELADPPSEETIRRNVTSALRVFLSAYGADLAGGAKSP